jgi:hypothetical protein
MPNRKTEPGMSIGREGGQPGRGQGGGAGRGWGRGQGGSRMGGGGTCLCPRCGHRVPHQAGTPCLQERCPSCGSAMVREGSPHHQEIERVRAKQEESS